MLSAQELSSMADTDLERLSGLVNAEIARMKLMNNCCSYIRRSFEAHVGIRYSKIESYANFFLYRWSHVRKHGMKTSIEYLLGRVAGTEKKINCSLPKEKDAN